MYTLFVILIVLASFCMIGIVLIQESKGGGLASAFSSANSSFGVRQTTNFIEKTTWTLAAAMVIISIICAYVAPNATGDGSVIEKAATEQSTTNPNNVQGFGAAPAAPAADAQQATPAAPAEEKK
jgi:preprotein translocase subunit SecG